MRVLLGTILSLMAPVLWAQPLTIMSYNTFLFPELLYPTWKQQTRVKIMLEADLFSEADVIVFQELFSNRAARELLSGLRESFPYQSPVLGRTQVGFDCTNDTYNPFFFQDGGVAIVSKYPITSIEQVIFKDSCGSESLAQKGFIYVQLTHHNTISHVIGTHLQSDNTSCGIGEPENVRSRQIKEIQTFVSRKQISRDHVVYIAGDLNIIKGSEEYFNMVSDLNVLEPNAYMGHDSTWDPTTNSMAHWSYPNLAGQYLDYILVSKNHKPIPNWLNFSDAIHSTPWVRMSLKGKTKFFDFSDHYPVIGFSGD